MGADIYLESVSNAARKKYEPLFHAAAAKRDALPRGSKEAEKAQEAVSEAWGLMYPDDGYFRDPYNPSSLFLVLGLSWWRDVSPMLLKGYLPITKAKQLRQRVADAPLTLRVVTAHWKEKKLEDTPQEWLRYWTEQRKQFLALLDASITLNERLYCSV